MTAVGKTLDDIVVTPRFHIPSLDGIRAVAAVMVFLNHAGPKWIPGGFGVTIFFFLSGYLITTLLRREYDRLGSVSLGRFYLRRAYRLFPPLFIVLALVGTAAWFGVFPHQMTFSAVSSEIFYWANYYTVAQGNSGFVPNTGVVWSLSIEEHFYFVYPLLFLLCVRHGSYGYAARAFLAICALVLLWRLVLVYYLGVSAEYTFRATDARFDSLLWGCLMGVWANPVLGDREIFPGGGRGVLVLAGGLALLLLTFIVRDTGFRESIRYTIQGIALLPLFWFAVRYPQWFAFRWLNLGWVRYLGAISYTFYLVHVSALVLAEHLAPQGSGPWLVMGFLLSLAFASAMLFFVEQPLARMRQALHRE